jgi:nucleotide-binding universal stress UspA family protein
VRLEKIVLATDFSAAARAALDHAIAIAARFGARLYLIHVVDVRSSEGSQVLGNEAKIDEFYDLAERRAREELAALSATCEPDDLPEVPEPSIPIVECVRIGEPSEEILGFATEKEVDLVVVGTHGRTGIRRVLVGSVAESVLRRAPCPVMAIRVSEAEEAVARAHPIAPRRGASYLARILAAVDSSESSRAALRASAVLAARFGSSLGVLNVVDDYMLAQATMAPLDAVAIEGRIVDLARATLDDFVQETLGSEALSWVSRRVEVGRPAETVARVAAAENASLVACGTHGRSGLRRALFGSVAERIVRVAPCPVLTVREGKPASRLAA